MDPLMNGEAENIHQEGNNYVPAFDKKQTIINIAILFSINLLNYMDRSVIPGVLEDIKIHFDISNNYAGLLSTVFICTYMLFAPLFGYLGDRYSRRLLMAFGVLIWSAFTLLGSFSKSNHLGWFFFCRAMVGIGEASYSCIAPSVIGDLFNGPLRSKMLAFYYLAIPVGSGLGYIAGSKVAMLMNSWQWALRITPPFGLLAVILLIFVVKEPARGSADNTVHSLNRSNYFEDLIFLFKNRTYVLTTLSFTAVAFVIGSISWWVPLYMKLAHELNGKDSTNAALYFGICACLGGFFGVVLGSISSTTLKKRTQRADPLICGMSVLLSVPFMFISIWSAKNLIILAWIFTFISTMLMSFTWSLIADIILFVVVPSKRATAEAVQILFSHLFGDASSPYIIGQISDLLKSGRFNSTNYSEFKSLQISLYINTVISIVGGILFLITSLYIVRDRTRAECIMRGSSPEIDEIKSDVNR